MQVMGNSKLIIDCYTDAFGTYKDLAADTLSKYGVSRRTEWCPVDSITSALYYTEEKIGKYTVRSIGRNISRKIGGRHAIANIHEFIDYLNDLYARNHMRLAKGFQIQEERSGYLLRFKTNPYPFSFNCGLIEGFFADLHLYYDIQADEKDGQLFVAI